MACSRHWGLFVAKELKWQQYQAIWDGSKASGNDLLLLLALASFRSKEGLMYAKKETLAEVMNSSLDTVERSLKRLKALGELDWVKGSNLTNRANRYFILLPGLDLSADCTADCTAVCTHLPPQIAVLSTGNLPRLNSNETDIKHISDFERFWGSYPRKANRDDAWLAFLRAIPLVSIDVLLAASRAYGESVARTELRFVKLPSTWLDKRCWLDQVVVDVDDWTVRAIDD
jgi:hypothetical protein